MADGLEFPAWLTQLVAAIAPAMAVLGFMVNRRDKIIAQIDTNDAKATRTIEAVRTEGAEALAAAIERFDSRHEHIRQEISQQMGFILTRVNSMGDTMARREDLAPLMTRMDSLSGRMDKLLDK